MAKEEIKKEDLYKSQIVYKANSNAIVVVTVIAVLFYALEIAIKGTMNWGFAALVFCTYATINLYFGIKLKVKRQTIIGCIWAICTIVMSIVYIGSLFI